LYHLPCQQTKTAALNQKLQQRLDVSNWLLPTRSLPLHYPKQNKAPIIITYLPDVRVPSSRMQRIRVEDVM